MQQGYKDDEGEVPQNPPALPLREFLSWLRTRVDRGESLQVVGNCFGVSHAAVSRWLSGSRRVPRMALILGALIRRDSSGDWPMD
jgi:hypothetical protein